MIKKIKSIIAPFIAAIIVVVVAFNVPAKWFDLGGTPDRFGADLSLTDILSTDNLSDFPTVQNANNTAIEGRINSIIGTTTNTTITSLANLATVGTITTGTWSADTITVSKGGTGSTTLSSNQVLLGNGTGALKVVAGYGTSGQFLTSSGAAAAPTWTTPAVDTAAGYVWSGNHTFNGPATTTNATSTYHGIGSTGHIYSAGTATSTFLGGVNVTGGCLAQNGICVNPEGEWELIASVAHGSGTSTSTLSSIPARDLLKVYFFDPGLSGGSNVTLKINNDPTSHECDFVEDGAPIAACGSADVMTLTGGTSAGSGLIVLDIYNSASSNKRVSWQASLNDASNPKVVNGTGLYSKTAQVNRLDFIISDKTKTFSADAEIIVYGFNY